MEGYGGPRSGTVMLSGGERAIIDGLASEAARQFAGNRQDIELLLDPPPGCVRELRPEGRRAEHALQCVG
jgi:hypothetical protein